jgi:hypothetical protein
MKLEYRVERMKLMVLHELNVPDYVENIYTQYGKNAGAFLTGRFKDVSRVRFLSNVPGEDVETDISFMNMSSACGSCSVERDGHTTWLMCDDILCEYEGTIWLNRRGAGKLKYKGMFEDRVVFQDFESLTSTRHKIIVRRVFKFLMENSWMNAIAMDFGWAREFCGSKSERIIFFDFLPIEESP